MVPGVPVSSSPEILKYFEKEYSVTKEETTKGVCVVFGVSTSTMELETA